MFPSGPFRSPNLHAPRHPAVLSQRIPLIVNRQFSSSTVTVRRGRFLYTPLVARSSITSKQFSVQRLKSSCQLVSRRTLTSTAVNMTGTKIDGNAIAKDIREKLKNEIADLQAKNPRFKPNLVIYQGERPREWLVVVYRY